MLNSNERLNIKISVAIAILFLVGNIYWIFFICSDPQCPVGLIFAPIYATIAGVISFVLIWATSIIFQYLKIKRQHRQLFDKDKVYVRTSLAILLVAFIIVILLAKYLSINYQAQSPNSTEEQLRNVYSYALRLNSHTLLMRLADNPATPQEILRVLSKHKYISITYRIADNRNTPVDILREFAHDEHWAMRSRIAGHPSTPTDVISQLTKDGHEFVRRTAKSSLEQRGIDTSR